MRPSIVAPFALTALCALCGANLLAQEPLWPLGPQAASVTAAPLDIAPAAYDIGPPAVEPVEKMDYVGDCGRCMYVQADGLYWHRIGTGCDEILAINTTTGDPLLSTNDLYFNGTGGFRVLVGWQPKACCAHCSAWEASYFGLFGLHAGRTITGAGDLAIPGDLGLASNNFFLADTLDIDYNSQVNNFELNCIKTCCLCCDTSIDFLCGFRYFNLNEEFRITGTDLQEGTSDYTVQTFNHLFGLQLGGRYNRRFAGCWSYQLTGKAAVFMNAAEQSQLATDFPTGGAPFLLRDRIGDTSVAVAALGELDFVLIRQLSDTWSVRFGYSVIGVGGLALAPDQLDFTDTFTSGSSLNTNGWIFLHGGLLGLEARW